jgi:hypothetical protein
MLSVFMLSVLMLSVVMLSVVMLSVFILSVIMNSVIVLMSFSIVSLCWLWWRQLVNSLGNILVWHFLMNWAKMYQTSILGLFTKKLYSITLKAFSGLKSLIFAAVLVSSNALNVGPQWIFQNKCLQVFLSSEFCTNYDTFKFQLSLLFLRKALFSGTSSPPVSV